MAAQRGYRSPARTLRKLADGHMLYDVPQAGRGNAGHEWDRFEVRNIGLAVQRSMAAKYTGDARAMRADSAAYIARLLDIDASRWSEEARHLFEGLALVLAMIPGIGRWSAGEKHLAARIVRAKARGEEARYLRLMQTHTRLREALVRYGS